ncbi:MAG: hypothetical protein ABI035_07240 [Gemmatimonadaceae bacterium]
MLHTTAVRGWRRFANLRLLAFILLAASVWWAAQSGSSSRILPVLATAAALAGFAALVSFSSRAHASALRLERLINIKEQGIHRVHRDWSDLEQRPWPSVPVSHPYATDLDIFGKASLAQLFPPLSMAPGRTTLAGWLLAPAVPAELTLRQQAVEELKDRIELRDELLLHTERINISAERLIAFGEWSGKIDDEIGGTGMAVLSVVIPLTALFLAVAQGLGLVSQAYWLIPIMIGGLLTMQFRKRLRVALSEVQGQRNVLRGYANVASLMSDETLHSPLLMTLRARLGSGAASAERRMRALERLADNTDVRLSPMLHFIVQGLTLWDFHVVRMLNRWKRTGGNNVDEWMTAIGVFESLCALATLAHDNPDWVFPIIGATSAAQVEAVLLGHPLLDAKNRVANDVTVGPPGTLVLITGSNMAGKSTLLRAIGLNAVLAQCGSVVCATRMSLPSVSLYTSMRVQDSLERGVSYFMAELERLKLVVDAANEVHADGSTTMLFLLDEILHGTNSAERTIAARHVLTRLIELGAIGAVTTHDLALADTPDFAGIAKHVHFQEEFSRAADGTPTMRFDYRLRPGKAESSNALKLLELVGLGVGLPPDGYPASPD